MRPTFLRIAVVLTLGVSISAPAHAQFGKLGDAVRKKAKEAVAGKEDPKRAAASSPSRSQLLITSAVLDQFAKGLSVEAQQRNGYVKYDACGQTALQSPDFQRVMAAQGKAMGEKIKHNMTDAQQMAVMNGAALDIQKVQSDFLLKKCGPPMKQVSGDIAETAGVEASGFTTSQYGMLKERITAYCEAVARGSDTPSDSKLTFTAGEMQALKPRCSAFLPSLRNS